MNRYFAASAMTTPGKQEPIKASQPHQWPSCPPSTPASTQLCYKPNSTAHMNPVGIAVAFTGKSTKRFSMLKFKVNAFGISVGGFKSVSFPSVPVFETNANLDR
jgi:hypothetical protein